MDKIFRIAHRGYSNKNLENTLEAFNNAIKLNFDMIELDVHLCKSEDIVIFHDSYINKNNKHYFIKDLTYSQILELNSNVITLPIFFDNINKSKIKINIDIKGDNSITKYLLKYLNSRFSDFENIILTSFNLNIVKEIIQFNKKSNKKIEKGFITENIFDLLTLEIILKDIEYLVIYWSNLSNDIVDFCHKNNKKIFCYTCKNKDDYKYIKLFNINGIVTDIYLNIN